MHKIIGLLFLSSLSATSFADTLSTRPDSHAPIGVMGDHLHAKGEMMLSYRAMFMRMEGNVDGSDGVSTADVLADFMVSPLVMDMQMHMLGGMYAPNDNVTMMAMIPVISNRMNHRTRMGAEFETEARGVGDISVGALIRLLKNQQHNAHANLSLSLPTGSVRKNDATPMGNATLPYPMQPGAGTYGLKMGATYAGVADAFSWGGQALYTTYIGGKNERDYRLGDVLNLTTWGAYRWHDQLSSSLRLNYRDWDDVDQTNPPTVLPVPTADPERRAGSRLDVGLGTNVAFKNGHRLAFEALLPAHQDLDGPQLETDWTVTIGWQKSIH